MPHLARILSAQMPSDGEFLAAPEQTVLYMGVPYAGSKLVKGQWYFPVIAGEYRRFDLQSRIRKMPALPHQKAS
jgi:hypothetical protein